MLNKKAPPKPHDKPVKLKDFYEMDFYKDAEEDEPNLNLPQPASNVMGNTKKKRSKSYAKYDIMSCLQNMIHLTKELKASSPNKNETSLSPRIPHLRKSPTKSHSKPRPTSLSSERFGKIKRNPSLAKEEDKENKSSNIKLQNQNKVIVDTPPKRLGVIKSQKRKLYKDPLAYSIWEVIKMLVTSSKTKLSSNKLMLSYQQFIEEMNSLHPGSMLETLPTNAIKRQNKEKYALAHVLVKSNVLGELRYLSYQENHGIEIKIRDC